MLQKGDGEKMGNVQFYSILLPGRLEWCKVEPRLKCRGRLSGLVAMAARIQRARALWWLGALRYNEVEIPSREGGFR